MAAVEVLERGFVKAGPVDGCARGCGACGVIVCPSRRPQTGELGKVKVSVVGRVEELFSKKSPGLREGFFIFGPAIQGSGESPITSEKICSMCREAASTCSHSKSKTSALAAA